MSKDEDIAAFFQSVQHSLGTIDFVVHSLAFANKTYLQIGKFTDTPRDVFKQALDISAYSLIGLARAAVPLMPNGGSIICLSYLGGEGDSRLQRDGGGQERAGVVGPVPGV